MKKLYRSNTNKVVFGLMGGIAEFFDTDPVLVRLLFLFVTIFTGVFPGIIAYLLGAVIVPSAPTSIPSTSVADDSSEG